MAGIKTILDNGSSGVLVEVECHLSNSLPNIIIVGIANKAVDEAKERIRSAFASSSIKLPKKRITLNLAPADIPKEGTSFDLPMIVAIMQASGLITAAIPPGAALLGEVGLDGSIRPVRGIIGKILAGRQLGIHEFWIPEANLSQASLIPNISVLAVSNLQNLYQLLNTLDSVAPQEIGEVAAISKKKRAAEISFEDVIGQETAKRALLIAAAGHHNIMLNGPPGTGKSMLAKALAGIMPELSREEMLEVTHLHSLASKQFDQIIEDRPVRAPHHSSSNISIIGGGQNPRPGEISLSHRGILFFDEFPEFSRSVIEALRQPLEDKRITVARAKDTIDFPAHFMLVATANPCPCGYYGTTQDCNCLPHEIVRYQKKISGPVIDRIDLYVDVEGVAHNRLLKNSGSSGESDQLTKKVMAARALQQRRAGKLNSELNNKELKLHAKLQIEAEEMLNQAAERLQISARSYMKALKVARTIADVDRQESVGIAQISEALQYRKKPVVF